MLLGNKKLQKNEQNWCLVLNPISSEIDKRKSARKISETFSLSFDEATDLVNNTPIILLDNLTHSVALQIKDFFQSSGAEMLLTNDVLVKRKCYRTVWPETPNLSFLNQTRIEDSKIPQDEARALEAEEALHELRVPDSAKNSLSKALVSKETAPNSGDVAEALKRAEEWRVKYENQLRDYVQLKKELGMQADRAPSNDLLHERDTEIRRLQSLLAVASEKYEGLQEEYRQARSLFEEKLNTITHEARETKQKTEQTVSNLAQREKNQLEALKQAEENRKSLQEWQEKYIFLEKAAKLHAEKAEARIKELEDQNQRQTHTAESLKRDLDKSHTKIEEWAAKLNAQIQINEALENKSQLFAEELKHIKQTLEESKEQYAGALNRCVRLEKEKADISAALEKEKQEKTSRDADLLSIRQRYEEKLEALAHDLVLWEEKVSQLSAEVREFEVKKQDWSQMLVKKEQEIHRLEKKTGEMETVIQELKATYENLEHLLQTNTKLLEAKDQELLALQKQCKDLKSQLAQRETLEKREMVARQIAQKEARLKVLVEDQAKIEAEIKDRELAIRKILTEQETVEKEILESKQTRLHHLDQKGEKKIKISLYKDKLSDSSDGSSSHQETLPK